MVRSRGLVSYVSFPGASVRGAYVRHPFRLVTRDQQPQPGDKQNSCLLPGSTTALKSLGFKFLKKLKSLSPNLVVFGFMFSVVFIQIVFNFVY